MKYLILIIFLFSCSDFNADDKQESITLTFKSFCNVKIHEGDKLVLDTLVTYLDVTEYNDNEYTFLSDQKNNVLTLNIKDSDHKYEFEYNLKIVIESGNLYENN